MPSSARNARRHLANLLPFWVYLLLFKTGAGMHYALIGVLGTQVLPLWAVGFATGGVTFMQLIVDIPAGKCIDRYGARRMLQLGAAFFVAAACALLFGLTPTTYLITLLCSAAGWLFFTPSVSAYLLSVTPAAIMGRTTGMRRVAESMGGVCATIGLAALVQLPPPILGMLLLYPLLGSSIVLWFLWHVPQQPARTVALHQSRAVVARSTLSALRAAFAETAPAAALLTGWYFASGFLYGVLWLVIALLIAHGAAGMPGYALSIYDGTMLVAAFALGIAIDRARRRGRIVVVALLCCIVALALMSTTHGPLFVVFAIVMSAADEAVTLALWAWLDARDTRHRSDGLLSGAITLADDLGWTLGPIAGSLLFAAYAPSVALLAAGIPTVVFLFVFLRFFRNSP